MSSVDSDAELRLMGDPVLAPIVGRWRRPLEACAPAAPSALPATPTPPPPRARRVARLAEPTPPPVPQALVPSLPASPAAVPISIWQRLTGPLRNAPSWLISMIIHLIVLTILGIFSVPAVMQQVLEPLEVAIAQAPELDLLAPVEVTPALEEWTPEVVDDPGAMQLDSAALEASIDLPHTDHFAPAAIEVMPVGGLDDLAGSAGLGASPAGEGTAEFFGVKAGGRKFVFVVDSSNSMEGQPFKQARQELLYAVKRLSSTQRFYVIFFDKDAVRMFERGEEEAEPRPLPATVANVRRLSTWVKEVETGPRTNPYDAMRYALEMNPDAIFLLSDGEFTDRGRTVEYLAEENIVDDPLTGKRPRVVIHTIGFHSKRGEATLAAIAKAYGGTYRFVPRERQRAR